MRFYHALVGASTSFRSGTKLNGDDGHLAVRIFADAFGGHLGVIAELDVHQAALVGGHGF